MTKEDVGKQNNDGKPWGTKMKYVYRDPKSPNNFMEMTEVRMSMNKNYSPNSAASDVQNMFQGGFQPPRPPRMPFSGQGFGYDGPRMPGEPDF